MTHKLIKTENYLLVVDDSEIKEGDYWHYISELENPVLNNLPTTWFDKLHDKNKYKKVTAHLPLNGSPILEGVPLLPPIEDDVEQLAEEFVKEVQVASDSINKSIKLGYEVGYDKAREKYKYTEEDMMKAISHAYKQAKYDTEYKPSPLFYQYPTEFECEMENYCGSPFTTESCPKCIDSCDRAYERPKTITTAQGIQWVGKYK